MIGSEISQLKFYHLGRGLAYLLLGGIAGAIGAFSFSQRFSPTLSLVVGIFLGLLFLITGLASFRHSQNLQGPSWLKSLALPILGPIKNLPATSSLKPFLLGLGSALLPCGWLYGFVLLAASTQSTLKGALLLFIFWLGGLPLLSMTPWLFRKATKPFQEKMPRLISILLVLMGLWTLADKLSPLFPGTSIPPLLFCTPTSHENP